MARDLVPSSKLEAGVWLGGRELIQHTQGPTFKHCKTGRKKSVFSWASYVLSLVILNS